MKFITSSFVAVLAAVTLYAPPSDAGCGLTVTFENKTGVPIKVLEVDAQVSGAPWATVLGTDFTIPANGNVVKAIELKLGCGAPHGLRAKYEQGSNTKYEQKGPILTAVDRKITLTFK